MRLIEAKTTRISAEDYPIVIEYAGDNYVKRFKQGIDLLNKVLDRGQTYKSEFSEIKRLLNYGVENAESNFLREPYWHDGRWEKLPKDLQFGGSYPDFWSLHKIPGVVKKLIALKKKFPKEKAVIDGLKLANELLPLSQVVNNLKDSVVSSREVKGPSKAEQKQAILKTASRAEVKAVKDVLNKVVERTRDEAYQKTEDAYLNALSGFLKQYDPKDSKTYLKPGHPFYKLFSTILNIKNYPNYQMDLQDDYKKVIKKEAKVAVDYIVDRFVDKNLSKLSEIVSKKGNLKSIKILRTYAAAFAIEGLLAVTFNDSSKFEVSTNVVFGYSKLGTNFVKYPTRFHKVYYSDGTKMSRPSEERMITDFAQKR